MVYKNTDEMNHKDDEINKEIERLSTGELTLEDIKLMSKFGRVRSVNPLRIEYDFTILDRTLTIEEYEQFNALINKLSSSLEISPEYPYDLKSNTEEDQDTPEAFIDFFSQFLPDNKSKKIADKGLAYGNENAPAIPNTSFFDLFFRALTSPQYIGNGHFSNPHEKISVIKTDSDITIKREIKGKGGIVEESQTIKISNLNFYKRNKKTVLIFSYLFQTLAQTPGANCVYLSYKELVDVGIYETVDGARRGVNNFYDYFHGNDKKSIPGVSVAGKFKTKERKSSIQTERDLVTGRDLTEGGQVIYLNSELNLSIFTAYTSFLPLWAYRLENLDAFLLVRYIFYTARMKGDTFIKPDRADQNNQHPYKYFTLSFDSVRDALGLPAPVDVTGRKYKEKIKDPIEQAIEDVEAAIASINAPEKSILVTLTPKGTDATSNIEEYLRCKLEIGIIDTFANSFIEAAKKHEKHVADFKKRIEANKARNAAKKGEA